MPAHMPTLPPVFGAACCCSPHAAAGNLAGAPHAFAGLPQPRDQSAVFGIPPWLGNKLVLTIKAKKGSARQQYSIKSNERAVKDLFAEPNRKTLLSTETILQDMHLHHFCKHNNREPEQFHQTMPK